MEPPTRIARQVVPQEIGGATRFGAWFSGGSKSVWRHPVVVCSLLAVTFYWLALPPCRQPWAAFVSTFFFAAAVYSTAPMRPFHWFAVYLCGCLLWLSLLQGIRLAFWPLYGGWVALSVYVAIYIPLFVYSAKELRARFRVPFPLACSISWTGWELVRSYFATGFSACMLGHSQTPWPAMLDVASHLGMFGVGFFIALSGACACYFLGILFDKHASQLRSQRGVEFPAASFSMGLCLTWVLYSQSNYARYDEYLESISPVKPLGRFLLVQHNMPTMFESDPTALAVSWSEYARATRQAVQAQDGEVDVVVWPESTFDGGSRLPWTWFANHEQIELPADWGIGAKELEGMARDELAQKWTRLPVASSEKPSAAPIRYLVGAGILEARHERLRRLNGAVWMVSDKRDHLVPQVDYYGKRHLVMFGEYIPIVSYFPDLLARFGMGTMEVGDRFVAWELPSGGMIAPSVCFENVVPHLIRNQIVELSREGKTPDLLVNVTNDAWFRGSSLLDHHLNNAIGCAVENRRPMLVAANSGVSAWIDSTGRIVDSLDRFETGAVLALPIPDGRWGLWSSIGDVPAKVLSVFTVLPLVAYLSRRLRAWFRKVS